MQLVTIKIKGIVDENWVDWFEGFELIYEGKDTILSGAMTGQADFYGLIGKLRDLGLQLLEVNTVKSTEDTEAEL